LRDYPRLIRRPKRESRWRVLVLSTAACIAHLLSAAFGTAAVSDEAAGLPSVEKAAAGLAENWAAGFGSNTLVPYVSTIDSDTLEPFLRRFVPADWTADDFWMRFFGRDSWRGETTEEGGSREEIFQTVWLGVMANDPISLRIMHASVQGATGWDAGQPAEGFTPGIYSPNEKTRIGRYCYVFVKDALGDKGRKKYLQWYAMDIAGMGSVAMHAIDELRALDPEEGNAQLLAMVERGGSDDLIFWALHQCLMHNIRVGIGTASNLLLYRYDGKDAVAGLAMVALADQWPKWWLAAASGLEGETAASAHLAFAFKAANALAAPETAEKRRAAYRRAVADALKAEDGALTQFVFQASSALGFERMKDLAEVVVESGAPASIARVACAYGRETELTFSEEQHVELSGILLDGLLADAPESQAAQAQRAAAIAGIASAAPEAITAAHRERARHMLGTTDSGDIRAAGLVLLGLSGGIATRSWDPAWPAAEDANIRAAAVMYCPQGGALEKVCRTALRDADPRVVSAALQVIGERHLTQLHAAVSALLDNSLIAGLYGDPDSPEGASLLTKAFLVALSTAQDRTAFISQLLAEESKALRARAAMAALADHAPESSIEKLLEIALDDERPRLEFVWRGGPETVGDTHESTVRFEVRLKSADIPEPQLQR